MDWIIVKQHCHEHSMRGIRNLPNISNLVTFLENPEVVKKVNECMTSLKRSFHISNINFLIAHAAGILLYRNCQRLGVIQNLTEQFNQSERTNLTKEDIQVMACV